MISETGMFHTVETLRNEMEMSCPGGFEISEWRHRKWEAKSQKVGEKGFGRDGRKMVPTNATHFTVLAIVVHSLRSQYIHIENTYTKHCNSNCPIGFLFLQLSL